MRDHGPMEGMMRCSEHMAGTRGHEQRQGMMPPNCGESAARNHDHHRKAVVEPNLAGQDAFAAIQEIVHILEADPATDWSKVNLEDLRRHLIDMNEVTLNAEIASKAIDGGIEVAVTGNGRTVEAIQRMVPAHAHVIEEAHLNGWSAKADPLPNGALLTVTTSAAKEVQHIQGLGFIGVMVSGHHHQPHHLGMARGEAMH